MNYHHRQVQLSVVFPHEQHKNKNNNNRLIAQLLKIDNRKMFSQAHPHCIFQIIFMQKYRKQQERQRKKLCCQCRLRMKIPAIEFLKRGKLLYIHIYVHELTLFPFEKAITSIPMLVERQLKYLMVCIFLIVVFSISRCFVYLFIFCSTLAFFLFDVQVCDAIFAVSVIRHVQILRFCFNNIRNVI